MITSIFIHVYCTCMSSVFVLFYSVFIYLFCCGFFFK